MIEIENDGFVLNLIGALSVELRTPTQHLALRPAPHLARAPLTLGPRARLHLACGEVVFEICAAEPQPAVPRPWLSPDWRPLGRCSLGVALVFLVLALVIFSIPADPRGSTIADAYGSNGLGLHGAGPGADGIGDATIGLGTLATRGRFGERDRAGAGPGYGDTIGQLATRRPPRVPAFLPGIASVRGTLDKEIIRRIVRRHLNEVRFCYTQALAAHPTLEGRLVVQFTIAATGQVLASALGSSTLGAPVVESSSRPSNAGISRSRRAVAWPSCHTHSNSHPPGDDR